MHNRLWLKALIMLLLVAVLAGGLHAGPPAQWKRCLSGSQIRHYYLPMIVNPLSDTEAYFRRALEARAVDEAKAAARGERPLSLPTREPVVSDKTPAKQPMETPTVAPPPAANAKPPQADSALCRHLVTRVGDQLFLEGKPFTFVGVNVSYLLEDYFPETEMRQSVAFLAESGVTVVRVWLYPQHSLDRAERLFDLGRKYNMRFVVTLENYYFDKGGWWFDPAFYTEKYLPHVRRVVTRFRDRPEIVMWELMNEPNCSTEPTGNCPANLTRWAQVVSEEIKALDPCHPITTGVIRIDLGEEHYWQLHAIPTIDVVSIHKAADLWLADEVRVARELGKPVLIGEVYQQAYNESCQHAFDRAPEKRAAIVAADLQQALAEGVDGYLLWQYGHGRVVVEGYVSYYCGIYDYLQDDPVWELLKTAPVSRAPISN